MKAKTRKKTKRIVSRIVVDAISTDTPLTAFLSLFAGQDQEVWSESCGSYATAARQKQTKKIS